MTETVSVWKAIAGIPVFFFLPGYAVTRFIRARKRFEATASETIYLSVALSVLLFGFIGLLLAEAALFTIMNLWLVLLGGSVLLLLYAVIKEMELLPSLGRENKTWAIFLLLLLILAAFMYARGFEQVFVVREPARYLAWGENIATKGDLRPVDGDIPGLSPDEFRMLFGAEKNDGVEVEAGWNVEDVKTGEMAISYFPGYGVMIAVFLKIFGLRNTLTFMNPFFALLGLLGLVLMTRRLFGRATAAVAGILLAINGLSIFFARYLTPEILAQFMVFAGLFCFSLFRDSENGWWGAVSSFCLCMTFTVRYDLYYILAPMLIAASVMIAGRILERKKWTGMLWFLAPIVPLFPHAVASQHAFSRIYLSWQYQGTFANRIPEIVALTILACAAIIAGAIVYRKLAERGALTRSSRFVARTWRPALVVALAVLCLFAFFVMPLMDRGLYAEGIPARLEDTFRMMFWYLTTIAFWLFLIGLVFFVLHDLDTGNVMFFFVCVFSLAVVTYSHFCLPQHMWVMRRYVIVAVPFVLVIAAYCLAKVPALLKARWLYAVSAAILVALIVMFSGYSAKVAPIVEFKGALGYVESLAEEYKPVARGGKTGPEPMLLFSERPASKYFPMLMRHVIGMKAFPCQVTEESAGVLGGLVRKWTAEGRRVYLFNSGKMPMLWGGLWPVYVRRDEVRFSYLDWVYDKKPVYLRRNHVTMDVYELKPDTPRGGYTVNIGGGGDTLFLADGFYEPWDLRGSRVRWTGPTADLVLPRLRDQDEMEVSLRMALGPRAGSEPSVPVDVIVDGRPVTRITVSSEGFREYRFRLEEANLEDANRPSFNLELVMPGWDPSRAGIGGDSRALGINIDSVEVSAVGDASGSRAGPPAR